jgi:hypothetical protein
VFLVTGARLESAHEVHEFGGLTVVIYTHLSPEPFLDLVRDDFLNAVRDEPPSAELAGHYRVLCEISRGAGQEEQELERYCELLERFPEEEPRFAAPGSYAKDASDSATGSVPGLDGH